jgi:hypothetical protein
MTTPTTAKNLAVAYKKMQLKCQCFATLKTITETIVLQCVRAQAQAIPMK